jgi:hypothetical protein
MATSGNDTQSSKTTAHPPHLIQWSSAPVLHRLGLQIGSDPPQLKITPSMLSRWALGKCNVGGVGIAPWLPLALAVLRAVG